MKKVRNVCTIVYIKLFEKIKGYSIGNSFEFHLWFEDKKAFAIEYKNGIEGELGVF